MKRVSYKRKYEPPFDKSEPCIACPIEVRDLFACAHNITVWPLDDHFHIAKAMESLKRSVARFQEIIDAHFEDTAHSEGRISSKALNSKGLVDPELL